MFILFLVHMCGQHKVAFTAPLIAILVALPSVYWTWPGLMSKEADWANQPSSTDRQTDRPSQSEYNCVDWLWWRDWSSWQQLGDSQWNEASEVVTVTRRQRQTTLQQLSEHSSQSHCYSACVHTYTAQSFTVCSHLHSTPAMANDLAEHSFIG